jgi:hypothetical protein
LVGGSEHVVDDLSTIGFGSAGDVLADLFAEERLERLGELAGDRVVVIDQQALEERLVSAAT